MTIMIMGIIMAMDDNDDYSNADHYRDDGRS